MLLLLEKCGVNAFLFFEFEVCLRIVHILTNTLGPDIGIQAMTVK